MLNKQTDDESHDSRTNEPIRTADTDADAEAQAAEARRRGTELIEDHLSSHLNNNPDSDYVTWIATLHPENAVVEIDQRFFVPGNPWWTVYESGGHKNNRNENIPTATAVPVAAPEDPPKSSFPDTLESKGGTVVATPSSKVCSPIDFLAGSIISISAIVMVYGIEFAAFVVYLLAACFYKMAQSMAPPILVSSLFYVVLLLVYWSLALTDSCLLLASVLTTESMAITAWIVSSLFAGCETAGKWHQYIRRTCHLARGSFRSSKAYHDPPRVFCGMCGIKKDASEEEEVMSPETYSSPRAEATAPPPPTLTPPSASSSGEDHVVMIPDENLIVEENASKLDDVFTQVYW